MALNDQHVHALLVASRETHVEEIDCDEFLVHMAQFAEARAHGGSLPDTLAKVEAHERLCANCAEESGALVELIQAEARATG